MKLLKVKVGDARPSMRLKVGANAFVEVYKDAKGFFYKIVIPGKLDYESKDRDLDQSRVAEAGKQHFARMKKKLGVDSKAADASMFSNP